MEPTLGDVSAKKNTHSSAEAEAAREFLKLASDRGLSLTGPDGLLRQFTKNDKPILRRPVESGLTATVGLHRGADRRAIAWRRAAVAAEAFIRESMEAQTIRPEQASSTVQR